VVLGFRGGGLDSGDAGAGETDVVVDGVSLESLLEFSFILDFTFEALLFWILYLYCSGHHLKMMATF
jgi:hypothetical protein